MIIPNFCSELAEEIGIHIGDGSMNFYSGKGLYQLRGHKFDDKSHYNQRIAYLFKKLFGININLKNYKDVYGFQLWNDELVTFKINLGLPFGKKIEMNIPSKIFYSKELMISFLRGIFDTDGCLYLERKRNNLYPRIEISSTSFNLINDISFILGYLDYRFSINVIKRKNPNWRTLYRVIIRGNVMVHKWFLEIKPMNSKHQIKYKKWAR